MTNSTMLNKMSIFFFSIDDLLLLLPLQAVQWKYYLKSKNYKVFNNNWRTCHIIMLIYVKQ